MSRNNYNMEYTLFITNVNVFSQSLVRSQKYVDIYNENSKYGYKLAELRIRAGLTKKELSNKLGISVITLRNVESGKCKNLYYYSLCCKYFNIDPYMFFKGLKENTYKNIVIKLRAIYCCESNTKLSLKIGLNKCDIDNSLYGVSSPAKQKVISELYKIKKRH